jgi:gamma-glutamyl hercynylcysteine S-oxide synthase
MELSKDEVFRLLKRKQYIHPKINEFICDTKKLYFDFLDILFLHQINGLQDIENCNPLLWEAYHPIWFAKKLCLAYFDSKYDYNEENLIYNSHICPRKNRFNSDLYNVELIMKEANNIFNELQKIKKNPANHYLVLLSILHVHMHLESYLFTRKAMFQDYSKFKIIESQNTLQQLEFTTIPSGYFFQGSCPLTNPFVFDNEMPRFKQFVNKFMLSKTVVTNHIFNKFILDDGYKKKQYWSKQGWSYINENKIILPKYWKYEDLKIKIYFNNNWFYINQIPNYPVCHISWWEAEAFCKWYGGRMILEKEWEYASLFAKSINPNLDYKNSILPVDHSDTSDENIKQMFGNVWEWCEEFIYPYNGYKIDPVYREYSYPFFGFKKIVKGSSWATPKVLNYPSYRNAQLPDCRYQYISFRVAKNLI